jgi:hypothetical protein
MASAPAYAAMVVLLRGAGRTHAVAAMLLWALLLGASMTMLCAAMPERAERVVIHGPAYWEEMSGWLETGKGRESEPGRFIPQHLLHAGVFVLLSLATASFVSIAFGAALMNYMAYYVARVVLLTPAHPVIAGLLGWHPWSVIRIASYVVLGVVLAEPLLVRLRWVSRRGFGSWWRWIAAGGAGLVLDIVLKALLAPHWPGLLRTLR